MQIKWFSIVLDMKYTLNECNKYYCYCNYEYICQPTDSIILNGKILKPFPVKSGMRQRCPLSQLLFSTILECLTNKVRERNTRTSNRVGKRQIIPICRYDPILVRL
jgi:hypothetical protein